MTDAKEVLKAPWLWIGVAVLVVAIGAVFWTSGRLEDDTSRSVTLDDSGSGPPATSGTALSPVADYLEFARATDADAGSATGDEYVVDGLRKLAAVLSALDVGGPELPVDLRVAAEHMLLNPTSTANAGAVREAFIAAAGALAPRGGNGDALRNAAESIAPDRPLTEQQSTVREFFSHAAEGIERKSDERSVTAEK